MTQIEFKGIFGDLQAAFPLTRIGETVENSWYKRMQKYKFVRVRAAFELLASNEKFPTLSQSLSTIREVTENHVAYVTPPWGFCYKQTLGDGKVQCGCSECQPEVYQKFSRRHHDVYGRYPWDSPTEPGKWEIRAKELAMNPGGREGFSQLVREIKSAGKDKYHGKGFQPAAQCVPDDVGNAP